MKKPKLKTPKYYVGRIMEINGGMEYGSTYLFETTTRPEAHAEDVARGWRGDIEYAVLDEKMGGYWSDDTLVKEDGFKEIPKADYVVLSKYLAVLS